MVAVAAAWARGGPGSSRTRTQGEANAGGIGEPEDADRRGSAAVAAARGRDGSHLQADVDLGDLELAGRALGDRHGDDVVALLADQRAADGRLVGELRLSGVGLG